MESANNGKIYILMNKPAGFVCTAASDSHKTVFELLPDEIRLLQKEKRGQRLHTVGRLDCDTSGLLLITNDGNFSHKMTNPEFCVEKKYEAVIKNPVSKEEQILYIEKFSKGVLLPAEKKAPEQLSLPCRLSFISETKCLVTVNEGKFHEVRRLFLSVGNEVLNLKRISMGNFTLPDDLAEGMWKNICIT
ncbi:MAG: pseudouridine synthase [Treponema sp.]|nr:pseudouridine synthase [Treponema sp.]